jgi:hypothetical protein
MTIQSKKINCLSKELNVDEKIIVPLTVAKDSDAIPAPKFLNEFYGVLNEDELSIYKINSQGFFRKIYSLDGQVQNLDLNKFQEAEFGKGNGVLWLQTKYDKKVLIFTSNWKLDGAINFVKKLEEKIEIIDRKLLK